jgi:hypothetical protein
MKDAERVPIGRGVLPRVKRSGTFVSRRVIFPFAGSSVECAEGTILVSTDLDPIRGTLIGIGDAFSGEVLVAGGFRIMELPNVLQTLHVVK